MKTKIGVLLLTISMLMSCGLEDLLDCYGGAFIKKELKISTFHKIDLDFPCEVILQKGTVQKIVIEGRDDMIRDLERLSSVSNDTWMVRIRNHCVFHSRDAKLFITVPDLSEIKVNGNAKIETQSGLNNVSRGLKCIVDGNASLFQMCIRDSFRSSANWVWILREYLITATCHTIYTYNYTKAEISAFLESMAGAIRISRRP